MPGGRYVLMNGLSGAVDLISTELGDALKEALWSERPELAQSVIPHLSAETYADFVERGHLTDADPEDERALVVTIAGAMHDHGVKAPRFMIVPNMDCNYRCTYCFERPLQNMLKSDQAEITHRKGNVVLGHDRIETIFDSIAKLQREAGSAIGGQIILYGGEPLDHVNATVVDAIVREGMARGYFFAAVTNGHDLEHFTGLIGRGKIEQVQISIDGPKAVHDKRRVYVGRESSFDKVVANIRLGLAQTDAQFQIRVHVDPQNIHHFREVLAFFEAEGWLDRESVVVYANTVYEKTKAGKVTVGIDNGDIVRQIGELIRPYSNVYASAPAVHAAMALRPAFEDGDRFAFQGTYCAANSGNYIFAPDDKLYACWESVGKSCSRIGTFDAVNGVTLTPEAVEKWFKRSIATIPGCQKCPYALVCGGGCAQYAEYENGNPYQPYCDDFQRVFRRALADHTGYYLNQVGAGCPSTEVPEPKSLLRPERIQPTEETMP